MDAHGQQQYFDRLWNSNIAQLLERSPVCAKKTFSTQLHHHYHQPELLTQSRLDPWIHAADVISDPTLFKWQQKRTRHFSTLHMSGFVEPMPIVASGPCSSLKTAKPNVFVCWAHLPRGYTCCVTFKPACSYNYSVSPSCGLSTKETGQKLQAMFTSSSR